MCQTVGRSRGVDRNVTDSLYSVQLDEQESPRGGRVAPGAPLFSLKTHGTPASNLSFDKKICTKYIKYILCNAKTVTLPHQ